LKHLCLYAEFILLYCLGLVLVALFRDVLIREKWCHDGSLTFFNRIGFRLCTC
jgi:hypothetical protein